MAPTRHPPKTRKKPRVGTAHRQVRVVSPPVAPRPVLRHDSLGYIDGVTAHDMEMVQLLQLDESQWCLRLTGRDGYTLDLKLATLHRARISATLDHPEDLCPQPAP